MFKKTAKSSLEDQKTELFYLKNVILSLVTNIEMHFYRKKWTIYRFLIFGPFLRKNGHFSAIFQVTENYCYHANSCFVWFVGLLYDTKYTFNVVIRYSY